ncbi:Nucleolar protein 9 [Xanthoria calcicola]
MPREHKKRGRREEKKRKREQEEDQPESKRRKSEDVTDAEIIVDNGQQFDGADYTTTGPGEIPFYGLLDEEEQEYFKRADSMLELDQFNDSEERALFIANVYKEANGKELKIANSQSCSRLMERLILMSTSNQLKVLFQKFTGHFLHLAQHRFASHCCETLFTGSAPIVSEEITAPTEAPSSDAVKGATTAEQLFLDASKELEGNLGYLMTDQFASHTLRVLLVVLSGRPLVDAHTTSLLQSRKKEHITLNSREPTAAASTSTRTVPDSFQHAVDQMVKSMVADLDTTSLRALASHPVANPLLQLLLNLEFRRSGKSKAKDTNSLFRKLIPDDPPEEGTDSAAFLNAMLYDPIGSRLCEVLVTHSPGKTFKILYQNLFREKLPSLAKNETASYVLIKALERLNKEDLERAMQELCPQIQLLAERARTSVVKCLIERCLVRGINTELLADALQEAYGQQPTERINKMLKLGSSNSESMSEERQKHIESHDPSKAHTSLLAQTMLDVPGTLQGLILDGILSLDNTGLQKMAKDRSATHVLQKSLASEGDTIRYRRMIMPRLANMTADLATDPVASHVVDTFWKGTEGLPFIREKVAEHLMQHEAILRESAPGRAVWRNWQMDTYKTKRFDWMAEAKGRIPGSKTGIELARERFANQKSGSKPKGNMRKKGGEKPLQLSGANAVLTANQS